MAYELRYRQIHLDFHTSEAIEGIGSAFDPEEFAATLDRARVNSVTAFARCHHGWLYYESAAFPERVHPHLARRDLLAAQVGACHACGIRVPAYITVQWDHYTSQRHPEWAVLTPDGRLAGTPPLEAGFYRALCVNSPYRAFLKAQTREVLESVPVDGIFFDIVGLQECVCPHCREGMAEAGLDATRHADRLAWGQRTLDAFRADMTAFCRRYRPEDDFTLFYNGGHIGPADRAGIEAYTHLEIESLPSGGWGYAHFPLSARYARGLGLDVLGMTGKFHTTWGDFHSFKNRAALEYECFRMLAANTKCGVGDQLHPTGRLCPHVYDLIGSVYREVERKEPWCRDARAVTEIGVLTPEEFSGERASESAIGVLRMLTELGRQFDILDSRGDLSAYPLLVLPDSIRLDAALAGRLAEYLAAGGRVLATFESGLTPEGDRFALDEWGVALRPEATRALDGALARGRAFGGHAYAEYVLAEGPLGAGLPPTEHAMYLKGAEVDALPASETLLATVSSYFDRTGAHFCSHNQTPSSGRVAGPAAVRAGGVVYFAHPLCTQYGHYGSRWCKTLLGNAIDLLLPDPLVRHNGPSTLEVTVNEQAAEDRWVAHLLHYVPERRATTIDTIEDVIPLCDIDLSLRVARRPRAVRLVPEGGGVPFECADGRVAFRLPRLEGHAMVEISF